jgi:dTDP-4-dehydrorhamnose reductase
MRILLTGITGQVGSALRGPLASLGTVLADEGPCSILTHPREIPGILDAMAPDLIVNPRAYTAVDQAEDERYRVNAEAPREMARAAGNDVPIVHFRQSFQWNRRSAVA